VDKDALELVAVIAGPGNHINVVKLAKSKGLEHIGHAFLGYILEDSRNTETGHIWREKSNVN
jgi:hypothetical protein